MSNMSMYKTNKPSASLIAKTKLQHDWSANRCVQHITSDWLDELLSDPQLTTLNSMVKVRLLLAGLLALDQAPATAAASGRQALQQQAATRAQLQGALQKLRNMVASDADEWDKIMAAAVGPMDGRLDLEPVMQRSPAVQESMTKLTQLVAESSNQQLMTPLEDVFLRELPSVLDPGAAHFAVRANPRVQPLSAGVSYAQATPPPPSLLRAQGVQQSSAAAAAAAAAAGAGQLPGGQKLARQKTQQGTPGAAGLTRAKSGGLTRQHTVQILDDEQQQAELFKNTHHKHGVAAAVRHEQLVAQPSDRGPSTQQGQHNQQQQQVRRQQQQLLQQQQQQQGERPKGRMFNIYGSKPAAAPVAAAPPPTAAPVQRVHKQRVDQMIDDLFDDDDFIDDRPIDHIIEPTGGSRTVRTLQHKYSTGRQGDDQPEGTPDDFLDDWGDEGAGQVGDEQQQQQQQGHGDEEMQDAEEGVEVITGGGETAAAAAAGPQEALGGTEEPQSRSAGKRRRAHVIASDSEDDD